MNFLTISEHQSICETLYFEGAAKLLGPDYRYLSPSLLARRLHDTVYDFLRFSESRFPDFPTCSDIFREFPGAGNRLKEELAKNNNRKQKWSKMK